MSPIVWAIILMVVGLALVVLEIFIPSGGILGFLAVAAVFGSIFVALSGSGTTAGFTFIVVALVGLPAVVVLAFKWLPNTPIGRRLLLGVPSGDEVLSETDPRHRLQALVGSVGIAHSDMLPGGTIKIDGETFEAVCEAGSIDQGEPVEVVKVRNNRLVVRKSQQVPTSQDPDDILSRPIDSVGMDPFDDSLS